MSTTVRTPARPMSARVPSIPLVRNRSRLALAAVLLLFSILLGVNVYSHVGDRHAVLVMARTVEQGQVITAADVRETQVAVGAGVSTVPAASRSKLVGKVAAMSLAQGALVTSASMSDAPTMAPSQARVGAALKPGQFPTGMRAGDHVALVVPGLQQQASDAGASSAGPVVTNAVVASVEPGSDSNSTTTASFVVDRDAAPSVASAGADGHLVVMVIPS